LKKFVLLLSVALLVIACTPSENLVQTSVAETQAVDSIVETLYAKQTEGTPTPTSTPSDTPTFTPTETLALFIGTVKIKLANLFAGPSPYHKMVMCGKIFCSLSNGTQVAIMEKDEHAGEIWYFVATTKGETGWLYSGWLSIEGNTDNIATASFVPTYPPLTHVTPTVPQQLPPNPSNPTTPVPPTTVPYP
jgi:hypothetical protein